MMSRVFSTQLKFHCASLGTRDSQFPRELCPSCLTLVATTAVPKKQHSTYKWSLFHLLSFQSKGREILLFFLKHFLWGVLWYLNNKICFLNSLNQKCPYLPFRSWKILPQTCLSNRRDVWGRSDQHFSFALTCLPATSYSFIYWSCQE